jgi:DNA-binding response OmpR family regulator
MSKRLTFGSFALDPEDCRLTRNGRPSVLSPRPFDLLVALVTRAGRLVTREELLREVWKDTVVEQSSLNAAMSILRQALGDEAAALIETVPGRGYRFMATLETAASVPAITAPPIPAPGGAVRAVIVDDHAIVRLGVRALLERNPGFSVVGEAATVVEAAQVIAQHHPDLLILDLMLNGDASLDHVAAWCTAAPGLRVIVLSMHNEDEFARLALTAGAHGYVMKEQMLGELTSAIAEVMGGGIWVSSRVSRNIVREVVQGQRVSGS